jgi:glycosyltransferase involved in cell wall biosynthesis
MKIAFIGQKGIPAQTGGVERYVESLALNLAQAGQAVFVYSRFRYSGRLKEYKGIHILPVISIPGKNLEAISQTFFACLSTAFRKFDVIHFQSIGPSSLLWLAKLLNPCTPIVFTFHCQDYYHQKWGSFARWYLKLGENIACHLADKIVAISKELEIYIAKNHRKESLYIPNGANLRERVAVQDIRRFGLEGDDYIVAISRLVRHKGLHHLIRAYQKIDSKKKLVIVGDSAHTDDYAEELRLLADNNPNIIFTGNQTGRPLAELFSNAHLFVQPSESEGLSISLLEAMSYGLPCLASDIPANKEALEDNGYFFQNASVDDLKEKLEKILSLDESELKEKGEKAKNRVRQEYDWQGISQKILRLYKDLKVE